MDNEAYKGGTIRETYHHEYGGYVFQPNHPQIKKFIEPYVKLNEAKAFLDGVAAAGKDND